MRIKQFLYASALMASVINVTSVSTISAQVTPVHVAQMKSVVSSVISPNGQFVAYTIAEPVDPKKENIGSSVYLYVLNTVTNESKAYFTSGSVSQVVFRPNKGTITFLSRAKDAKVNSLYEVNLSGGEAQKIYTHKNSINSYKWSHDGMDIAFISTEKGKEIKTTLPYSPVFFEENYNDRNVYVVRNVTKKSEANKLELNGSAYFMSWSPNGKQLAVSVAPTASVDDSYMAQKIKVINIDNNEILGHIDNEGKLTDFTFSPDGKQIAILGAYDLNDPTGGSISIVSAQGGKPKVINGDFGGKYEAIEWSDNNQIHYLASEGTKSTLGTLAVNGMSKYVIYSSSNQNITSFSKAGSNQFSLVINTPEHPSELYLLNTKKSTSPNRITNSNPFLSDLKLGKQEVVKYKARDGKYEIEGMVIYPLNYIPGEKYPLITVVHGGPESHYSNGWLTNYSMPGQMGAAKGYVIFYPNYRGSTGRGIDFTYSSQGDLAGKEFDDIVDGVDYLINKGIVDSKRVGVTGGSYGGYASAWMSTYYSHRFAAAVMFVGISNNISKFGTSDIPTEMKLVHERGNVWDNWQKQLEISPIYHADKAQTPILIMHGAEDPRVHPAQSMELYRHLRVRKPELPVRLIYYPGEGHGNARSGSRYDYNLRMLQWFDTYLKTGNPNAPKPSLDLPE